MLTLLHISDLHFGPPFVPQVGDALLRIAPTLNPDCTIISGDLTQRATEQQFIAARDYLQHLPTPQVVIPGNHDVPLYRIVERLFRPHDLYRKHINPALDHITRIDNAIIVALDSTAPRRAISNGRITRAQLDMAGRALADAPPDALRIIVSHHHFAPAPDYEQDQVLPNAQRALEYFLDLNVDLILGGHLHRAYIGNSLDVYAGHRPDRGIIIVQSGTTTSRRGRAREREKNSFNLLHLSDSIFRITHYMYFDDLAHFAPISQHTFPRPALRTLQIPPVPEPSR
jgi:3',5'-cyclic AMP phosphodiesterase CpdA